MGDDRKAAEAAIAEVLQARRAAWNAGDLKSYRQLLTEDADVVSATGRKSTGRDAVIALSAEQKRQPSYRDAIITATQIDAIRLVKPDVALVDATYRMTGVRIPDDSWPKPVEGSILFVMVQQGDAWRIASIRALPPSQSSIGLRSGPGGTAMGIYEKGDVRIHYEEAGSGFPLLLIAGGGLNSTIAGITGSYPPFNAMAEFKDEYRCIAFDLRNAPPGQSSGPLEIERPWDSHTDDQLGLMDHLGIDRFMVLGFCIGGPLIWNLLKRAPQRVVAGVLAMPSGSRPEMRDLFYENNIKGWAPQLLKQRPDLTMATVEKFLTRMYRSDPDFVFTVTRDFVRQCRTPVLVLPDDIPAHPYDVAMETAMLAPNAEVSMFPWKEPKERVPLAVRQIRSFLRAHRP
ncbi:MAG: SgcJ/EcaC family oxidoreductase [Bradyrhizobium sp.]|nr:SgcJ/EcaC family oxidoreductase [Bradyrhizobium sp.]